MKIILYKTKNCPRCAEVEEHLAGLVYERIYLDTADGLAEARVNGVFSMTVPVLQVGGAVHMPQVLFSGDTLKKGYLEAALRG